ncbi:MAG TPA: ATP-binding cassette domain-containing protein [bacterium]|jgi:ABC-2 type transport system ATP-binding protein|nr:ATP-binding cassette domain-containing protein [bacterium]
MPDALAMDVRHLGKDYTRRLRKPGFSGALQGLFFSQKQVVPAVRDLSFRIRRGEQVGLIGENGAGKSTTVKMLCGILVPSAGTLSVLGMEPWRQRRRLAARIGVVFGQKPQLLWDIPVRETFSLLKEMYGIPQAVFDKTYPKVVDLLDLEPLLASPVRQLSLGQRMRCDLAAAVLHAPDLTFLDEPTIGLDVVAKQQARELIKWLAREFGSTLILTTHDLTDITETCQRVILLDKGGLLFDGSLKRFEDRFARERRVVAELERPLAPAQAAALKRRFKTLKLRTVDWSPLRVCLASDHSAGLNLAAAALLATGRVAELDFERTEVEEIVRQLYSKAKAARA